jgi:hypothetical protein
VFDLDMSMHDHVDRDVENDERRLVSLGERSIGPSLDAIRDGDTDASVVLPGVLRSIGEAAHKELIYRINNEFANDGWEVRRYRKLRYVHTLQDAFGDYSRFPLWFDCLRSAYGKKFVNSESRRMRQELIGDFQGVPNIADDRDEFTPEFIAWYRKHTSPAGPFPTYDFSKPAS